MVIIPAVPGDGSEIELLLDVAFGPERRRRTAYALREGAIPLAGLSMVARGSDGALLGSVQCWPIELVGGGRVLPLTLLGPVAVAAAVRKIGLGRKLIAASLARADAAGHDGILLIGDLDYYGRFGFSAAVTGGWTLPGPVERRRLLLRSTGAARAWPAAGEVRARPVATRLAA